MKIIVGGIIGWIRTSVNKIENCGNEGNINSINSVGTNNLIKQGAQLVTNFNEILHSTF